MTTIATPPWEPAYASRVVRMEASEIRELLKLLDQPGIISFAGGIPDPKLFPAIAASLDVELVRRAMERIGAQRLRDAYRDDRL